MRIALTKCRVFTGEEIVEDHSVLVEDCIISAVVPVQEVSADFCKIELDGQLLAPGFIDTQVNGGGGVLLNDNPSVEAIRAIGAAHRVYGTTGFLPTLISDSRKVMQSAIAATRSAMQQHVPGVLGVHLEGPFLSVERKGVHPPKMIRSPESDALELLSGLGELGASMVTLAPEQVPKGFIRHLVETGVIVAAGHSAASYEQIRAALSEGMTGFTHLFNAMSPLNSREPGVVGAALEDENSWCGLIVDNHHVHPASLKVAIRAKPRGRMMLVTDAVHTVGAEGDTFELMGNTIVRDNGRVATLEGVLAGSDLDMATAVRNSVELLGLSLEESLRMASLYPAEFLRVGNRYGRIATGYQADLVLLDDQLKVLETWIGGEASGRY
ncbi:MAG: N-acetylglucosamine-6-phosphate deacetylase [Amphritea sp.]